MSHLYFAFLRAINVGGHTVKMDYLRQLFESLGFVNVETYIASGNVIFESTNSDAGTIEREIAGNLHQALGYEVATFLRTPAELAAIARSRPFPLVELDTARALNIAFLCSTPDTAAQQRLMGLETAIDEFHIHGREVYWLCRKKQNESTFSNAVLEKTIGKPSTLRTLNTILKLAEKYNLLNSW